MRIFLRLLIAMTLSLSMLPKIFANEIAITIDDLPLNGTLPQNMTHLDVAHSFINAFQRHKIRGVTGFVVGTRINADPTGLKVLKAWTEHGHALENHTYSHPDLSINSTQNYIDDISANERYITYFMRHSGPKYFRFPYLSEGDTPEKRDAVREFLHENNYTIAPASLFFSDWMWADPYVRCVEKKDTAAIKWLEESYLALALEALEAHNKLSQLLVNRKIKYILLLHFNAFNAAVLDKLLTAYQKQGVKFISIAQALTDPIYQQDPNVVFNKYPNFMEQVAKAKQVPVPNDIYDVDNKIPVEKLRSICQ